MSDKTSSDQRIHERDALDRKAREQDDNIVDEASEESFPASDSPAWTPTGHTGGPEKKRDRKDQ